jgi:predicted AAA+ superfamily ATPase
MYKRKITQDILDALSDTPVVFLRGARQSGKSTLVQAIAGGPYPARYLTLDSAGALSAAAEDPAGFIAGLEKPVVIDEAQRLKSLFLAIKEDVDRKREPGRYLLTGSTNVLALPSVADALVGRMDVLTLWPLCIGEIVETGGNIIDLLFDQSFPTRMKQRCDFELAEAITSGGFPEPLQRTNRKRRRAWFEAYITTILDRDIRSLTQIQDLTAVPHLLKLLAGRTATLHNQSEVSRSSGIANTTLSRYMAMLKTTFLVQALPAWSANLGKRLVKAPKLYMADTGLACHLLDMDKKRFRQGGEMAGRLFENFVVLELFKHAAWSEELVQLFHFRSQSGREVDVVIESGGRVVGIEIKLSATPSPRDFAGLKMLQKHLGEKFVRGVLIHTGREVVPFGKNLHAVAISELLAGDIGV